MAQYKTPAVYIQEIPGFTNSVVEVETAVPAFIGYTEKAMQGPRSLTRVPFRISSMFDYMTYFGGAPNTQFDIDEVAMKATGWDLRPADIAPVNSTSFKFKEPDSSKGQPHTRNYLYYSMQMFFANGGGACYIVSVGSYADAITEKPLKDALELLKAEPEPTMIVVPDAMSLAGDDAIDLQEQILLHCSTLKSRVAILDLFGGDQAINIIVGKDPSSNDVGPIDYFRNKVGTVGLDYGAAYYPWIETSIVETSDVDVGFLTPGALRLVASKLIEFIAKLPQKSQTMLTSFVGDLTSVDSTGQLLLWSPPLASPPLSAPAATSPPPSAQDLVQKQQRAHHALQNTVPFYQNLMDALLDEINLLPPSGAIAGVYARTDFTRGVFKAPAGTSILSAVKPVILVTDDDQEDLNVPLDGKAVNAIRAIPGYGVMVWGARTLNGNSQDTRYVNVRRTMIMLEQSIKNAMQAFMFEPNTATTWVSVDSMISNFLLNQWKQGALFGATPAQAYSVQVGLGLTMTADDILDGYMYVTVKVAIVRPAEFIVLTFQQTMPSA